MDITKLIKNAKSPADAILRLKDKSGSIPTWAELKAAYYPKNHPVMDKAKYPDVVVDNGDGTTELVAVTRVTFDLQRLAVKRMNELMFGIPVKRVYKFDETNENQRMLAEAMENIFARVRIDSMNIARGRSYFASCETMTLWYGEKVDTDIYGIPSKLRLRCVNYSPMNGDEIYPLFDEYGDLVALSVQYTRKQMGQTVTYFDSYTAETRYKWSSKGDEKSVWVLEESQPIVMHKIPAIYACRETPIWEDTSDMIYEMEWAMSRNGNYIRENSRPLFVVFADEEIKFGNEPSPNKTGKGILKYPRGSSANYVTWNQSVESLKFHVLELRQNFFTQLQLPDWSFENMKSVPMSGEAMKQMFIDAILKVRDESGVWLEFFDREVNVVKAFMKLMFPNNEKDIDAIQVSNVITPCTVQQSETDTDERSGEQAEGGEGQQNRQQNQQNA